MCDHIFGGMLENHQWIPEAIVGAKAYVLPLHAQCDNKLSIVWWFEYVWPTKSGTIRRCGLTGGSVALLEVCHCGGETLKSHIDAQI